MPRGRSKKLSRLERKKQQTDARLMEIQWEVDEYISKNKSITESKAESFLQEMTSYKNICCRDPRSMQVLEKLTYIMKSIIDEERSIAGSNVMKNDEIEFAEYNFHFQTEYGTSSPIYSLPSPVYSVSEEDKILTKCFYDEIINNGPEIINNNVITNNIETIDLCSDDDDKDLLRSTVQEQKAICTLEKSISNMSLCLTNNEHLKPDKDLNSQNSASILADTPDISHVKDLSKPQQPMFQVKDNVDKKRFVNPTIQLEMSIKKPNKEVNACNDRKQQVQKATVITETTVKENLQCTNNSSNLTNEHHDIHKKVSFVMPQVDVIKQNENISKDTFNFPISTESNIKTNANTVDTKNSNIMQLEQKSKETMKIYPVTEKKAVSKENVKINKQSIVNKPKKNTKRKNKNTIRNKVNDKITCSNLINNDGVTKNNIISNLKNVPLINTKRKYKKTSKSSKAKKNSSATNFDDLSWLKSIRYVREPDNNEYQTGLYDEHFWDNFTFPSDINDQDFII